MKLRRAACIAAVLVLAAAACSGDDAERPDRAGTEGGGNVESGDTDSSTLAEAADGSGTPERLGGSRRALASLERPGDPAPGASRAVQAGGSQACILDFNGWALCWDNDQQASDGSSSRRSPRARATPAPSAPAGTSSAGARSDPRPKA